MVGSVTRQNVCQAEAPSVAAACSCSSPTSISTGTTSRTTNGNDTNTVASTIPAGLKMIGSPWPISQLPNQPPCPYTSTNESPMITGETTNGTSTSVSKS